MSNVVGPRVEGSHNNNIHGSYLADIEAMKLAKDGWDRRNHTVEDTPCKANVELEFDVK
jgi:hypothetical protein